MWYFQLPLQPPEIYPMSMMWWSIPNFLLIRIWTIWQLTWASSYPCHSCVSTYIHNWDFVCVCGSPVNWNRVSINFNDFMCTLASCMHAWGGTSRPSSWPFDSSLKVLHPLLYPIALTSSSFCHSMTLRLHHFEEENFTLSQWQKGKLTFTRMTPHKCIPKSPMVQVEWLSIVLASFVWVEGWFVLLGPSWWFRVSSCHLRNQLIIKILSLGCGIIIIFFYV